MPAVMTKDPASAPGPAHAARIASETFGVLGTATPLPGEFDDNFRLDAADGHAFVLKVMHRERDPGFVAMLADVLRHLAREAPGLALPRVVPALDGQPIPRVTDARGEARLALLLTWVHGVPLAQARPRTRELHESLGRFLGDLDRALAGFDHPAAHRELKWDLARAGFFRDALPRIADPSRRALATRFLERFDEVAPVLSRLRRSAIHGDGNDWNALVNGPRAEAHAVVGVIDFGDMHHGLVVAEPAVAAAYAVLGQADALAAATAVVRGYHRAFPLSEDEIAVLFPLIGARLAVSVANSAQVSAQRPDDPYVTISEAPAWEALERLARVPPAVAHARFRWACGLAAAARRREGDGVASRAVRRRQSVRECPRRGRPEARRPRLRPRGRKPLPRRRPARRRDRPADRVDLRDTEAAGPEGRRGALRRGPRVLCLAGVRRTRRTRRAARSTWGSTSSSSRGRECAPRSTARSTSSPRTPRRLDYGPLVVLRHEPEDGVAFFTLYGHLSQDTLPALRVGQRVAAGQAFARVGAPPTNGDWAPHVHVQVILDLLGLANDFPGVARASERELWTALSPDPNLLLGIPRECFPLEERGREETLAARRRLLGRNLSLAYRRPLEIVRGWMQHLYDETGRAYLDTFNNVPLVGHSHPRVVRAAQEQLSVLNTNTRYLHDNAVRYAERLTALLPEPLRVCYFVSSGSEANELALRLSRARTGREDVIVLEHAYHGNTATLVDVSPYKFDGPGGGGRKPFVHVVPLPDDYRGAHRRSDPERGARYAQAVGDVVAALRERGAGACTFLAESLPSVGGQVVLPPGYLAEAYRHVRAAGGVCIADEVQVGFGRLGTRFWGFETQDVVPDVVVMGKPIGNGFPLAAVVTTPEIAAAFDNGMEYFATFGGNPVACAVGLAVLDVLRDERLQESARRVGGHLRSGLEGLMTRHALVGDVRGSGLFLGVELVRNRTTLEPATEEASYVVNRLRERGILSGVDGPYENVLKLRPPLVFGETDADRFVSTLDDVLAEDPVAL